MYSQLGALDHRVDQLVNHLLAELAHLCGRQVLDGDVGGGWCGFGHLVYQNSAKHSVAECLPLKDSSGYLHQSSQGTRELSLELNS